MCKYFEPPPTSGFVSGPGGGTVVNAVWLPDSHFDDSGSDWSSPCSSLRPFLLLSPTVPFCCSQHWEWAPGVVSGLSFPRVGLEVGEHPVFPKDC